MKTILAKLKIFFSSIQKAFLDIFNSNTFSTNTLIIVLFLISIVVSVLLHFYIIFVTYLLYTVLFYVTMYLYRPLPLSVISFFKFLCNITLLTLFLYSFYRIFFLGLPKPIFVQDLSLFSIYRYTFFLIITTISFTLLIVHYFYPLQKVSSLTHTFAFPYLKEEIRILLDSTWFDEKCSNILDFLSESKLNRYFFYFIHSSFIVIIPFIQSIFFFNFAFLSGDLRYNLYIIPFSFLSFIYSYLIYYLFIFFEESSNYVRLVLDVQLNNPMTKEEIGSNIVKRSLDEMSFSITPFGKQEGFFLIDSLIKSYYKFAYLSIFFSNLKKWCFYFQLLNVFIMFISWIVILESVYFKLSSTLKIAPILPYVRTLSKLPQSQINRNYATKAYYLKKQHQKDMEHSTLGDYKSGHPISTDLEKKNPSGNVEFINQLTHGKGPKQNPSKVLDSDSDVSGKPIEQKAVFPKEKMFFPPEWLNKAPIKDSESFFNNPQVKGSILENSAKS